MAAVATDHGRVGRPDEDGRGREPGGGGDMIRVAVRDQHRAHVAGGESLGLQLGQDGRARGVHAGVDQDGAVVRLDDPGVGSAGLDTEHVVAGVDPRPVGRLTRGEQEPEQQDGHEQQDAQPERQSLQDLPHDTSGA